MGHLINPIAVRLGLNYTWECVWVNEFWLKNRRLIGQDLVLQKYLRVLVNRKRLWKTGIFVSHFKIFRTLERTLVLLFVYEGGNKPVVMLAKRFLKRILKKYNRVWYKKRLKFSYLWRYKRLLRSRIVLFFIKRFFRSFSFVKRLLLLYYKLWVRSKVRSRLPVNVDFFVYRIDEFQLSAASISNYVAIKLRQHFKLKTALTPVLLLLDSNKYLLGYKIVCSGRFRRKEMAERLVFMKGKVSLNTFSSKVDYSASTVILKYSLCGIKVWLNFKRIDQKYKFIC